MTLRSLIFAMGIVFFVMAALNIPRANWLAAGLLCWFVLANWSYVG